MLILAVDTASAFCATGLCEKGRMIAEANENIGKGHAEYLMNQIVAVMAEAQRDFAGIDRIGVNIGPGSFTGVRVGIAAARGLALAIERPVIGVSAFEALACEAAHHHANRPVTVVLEAYRGELYVQDFDAGARPVEDPRIDTAEAIATRLPATAVLTGSAAQQVARLAPRPIADTRPTAQIATYALLAAAKSPGNGPVPLYMRAPDARSQAGSALPRI